MSHAAIGYDISEVARIIGAEATIHKPALIRYLVTDSRKAGDPDASLFFALKGTAHDGHDYVEDLFRQGYRNFVVNTPPPNQEIMAAANVLVVKEPLRALQDLAAHHRSQFSIPVIGITGSNGKTIVKEWLFQLMREDKNIVRSPKSYNSQLGAALSVWKLHPDNELAIFEAGISQPGEMNYLRKIIRPTIGLITNIGHAHDENFRDHSEKAKEKIRLFDGCETLVYCKDHEIIHKEVTHAEFLKNTQMFTWSRKTNANLVIAKTEQTGNTTYIKGICQNKFLNITIPFTDHASVENAIHCWAILLHLGYDPEVIRNRMKFLPPVAMRLELKEGINGCSIINDFYNSDLESLNIALDFLKQQQQHAKRTVILSDLLQSGQHKENLYGEIAGMLEKKGIQRLIGIGPDISSQAPHFPMEKSFFRDTQDFLTSFQELQFHDETILLKGARHFGFEQISRLLQQKAHETILEINLTALVHNLQYFRSRLNPETGIMVMVKAFSYGSGSFEVANMLQFHRANYLAVAYADEGVALRKAGITLPIMVMSPQPSTFDAIFLHNLEAEIYSMQLLDAFIHAATRFSKDLNTKVPVHIKLDTGMHRLGFQEEDINQMIVKIRNSRALHIKSLFTHLAASESSHHDEFTRLQLERFDRMCDTILPHFAYPILKHALNTAGIQRFPDAQYDMVRLGIGLYGMDVSGNAGKNLQQVGTLRTTISQIKQIRSGETIGYGRSGKALRDMITATIPIGYADGYDRRLGNGNGYMLIGGKKAPTVGHICMDMCMVDVTGFNVSEGDEVIVFGEQLPLPVLSDAADTIPYELLTGISERVKRVYVQE